MFEPAAVARSQREQAENQQDGEEGKNAADFGLAFWAGRLATEMPAETEFIILSQDGDWDHVVNCCATQGLT